MSLLWPPITTPQLGGVIVVTFFEKMIRCGAREKTNICRPWRRVLWKGQRWIGILVNWGCFLQNYELKSGAKKSDTYWNVLLIKNPQFLPNHYETSSKWSSDEVSILTKSHTNWAKIVDFLIKAHFSMCPIFFGPDFI